MDSLRSSTRLVSSSSTAEVYRVWETTGRERSESSTSAVAAAAASSMVSEIAGKVFSGVITCAFALIGALVGAITGALMGLATESGLFRGAGIGAISGAVFCIEAVESSFALWYSSNSSLRSILYVVEIICSLINGRLVREKVGPAIQSAVQSQMSEVDSPFVEAMDFFDTGGTKGMSKDSVNKIPKIRITSRNNVDESGEKISCSVCLEDLQIGETARSLPQCRHIFHLPCIDSWLIRDGSCPLCRRNI